jgi:sugar phosphate isomerase/epimerase
MADKVDDIELVLFESHSALNLPGKEALLSMQQIANENDLTFTVHFPIDRKAGATDAAERRAFRETVVEIIERTRNLPISGYLLHFEGLADENDASEVRRWTDTIDEFCDRMLMETGMDPTRICVENLAYDPALHKQIIDKYRFSYCIDVGHLWRYSADWRAHVLQVMDFARIIHLHGVADGQDHLPLPSHAQQGELQELASMLRQYSGVVTLEVFGEHDTFTSIARFKQLWHQLP